MTSLWQLEVMSVRQRPEEKFQALTSPQSDPVMRRRCVVSNAMLVIARPSCAFSNLQPNQKLRFDNTVYSTAPDEVAIFVTHNGQGHTRTRAQGETR